MATVYYGGTGTDPLVKIDIVQGKGGTYTVTVTALPGTTGYIGDLRGFFIDFADAETGVTVSNFKTATWAQYDKGEFSPVSASSGKNFLVGKDNVTSVGGNDNTMEGNLSGGDGYDIGFAIGTAGISNDDIRQFSFTIAGSSLSLADLENATYGVRMTSVGAKDGPREDSLKISKAADDFGIVGENETKSFNVLLNDVGKNKTLVSVDSVTVGGVKLTGPQAAAFSIVNGQIQYNGTGFDYLPKDVHETVVIRYTMKDGSSPASSSTLTLTIVGANDTASIVVDPSMVNDRAVNEDGGVLNGTTGDSSASGKLLVSDVDAGQAVFKTPGSLAGTYGTFTFNANTGSWSYLLDQTKADSLTIGQRVTDTLKVQSFDGTATHDIVVNITGTNDAPVVTGAVTGAATEDGAAVSLDALGNASDVDAGTTLNVVNLPANLPAGVTYNAVSKTFTLDPSAAARLW
jgi:VCBS repeat-containing protein